MRWVQKLFQDLKTQKSFLFSLVSVSFLKISSINRFIYSIKHKNVSFQILEKSSNLPPESGDILILTGSGLGSVRVI